MRDAGEFHNLWSRFPVNSYIEYVGTHPDSRRRP